MPKKMKGDGNLGKIPAEDPQPRHIPGSVMNLNQGSSSKVEAMSNTGNWTPIKYIKYFTRYIQTSKIDWVNNFFGTLWSIKYQKRWHSKLIFWYFGNRFEFLIFWYFGNALVFCANETASKVIEFGGKLIVEITRSIWNFFLHQPSIRSWPTSNKVVLGKRRIWLLIWSTCMVYC